jgi:hypothetical protein
MVFWRERFSHHACSLKTARTATINPGDCCDLPGAVVLIKDRIIDLVKEVSVFVVGHLTFLAATTSSMKEFA